MQSRLDRRPFFDPGDVIGKRLGERQSEFGGAPCQLEEIGVRYGKTVSKQIAFLQPARQKTEPALDLLRDRFPCAFGSRKVGGKALVNLARDEAQHLDQAVAA